MKILQIFGCFPHSGAKGGQGLPYLTRHYIILCEDNNEKYKSIPCLSSWQRPCLLPATLWSDCHVVWLWYSTLQCFILSCWMFWQCGFTGCDLTQLFTGSAALCVCVCRPGWAASCSAFCHAQCDVEPVVGHSAHRSAHITPDHLSAAISCLTYRPLCPHHSGACLSTPSFSFYFTSGLAAMCNIKLQI